MLGLSAEYPDRQGFHDYSYIFNKKGLHLKQENCMILYACLRFSPLSGRLDSQDPVTRKGYNIFMQLLSTL